MILLMKPPLTLDQWWAIVRTINTGYWYSSREFENLRPLPPKQIPTIQSPNLLPLSLNSLFLPNSVRTPTNYHELLQLPQLTKFNLIGLTWRYIQIYSINLHVCKFHFLTIALCFFYQITEHDSLNTWNKLTVVAF